MSKETVVKTLNLDSHVAVVRNINNVVVNSSKTQILSKTPEKQEISLKIAQNRFWSHFGATLFLKCGYNKNNLAEINLKYVI